MKYGEFKKKVGAAVFSRQDIRLLGLKVFDFQLTQWRKQGYITKLKNGVYLFVDEADQVAPEDVAELIYGPSYISLEKALSIWGLIPEMVYAVTSVTPKTTRKFSNALGNFSYRHIKPALYFGYSQWKEDEHRYLLAEPEKAILDLFYLNKINSEAGLHELRINWRRFKEIASPIKLQKYLRAYKNTAIKHLGRIILGRM